MAHRTVADIMTTEVVSAREDTAFKEAVAVMAGRDISALPVLDARGAVVGVVSESDLLRKEEYQDAPGAAKLAPWRRWMIHHKASGVTVRDVMSSPAITIRPGASVAEAARMIDRHHVKRLPVVGAEGDLVGIASRQDLLRVFLRSDRQIADEVMSEVFQGALGTNPALVGAEVREGVVTLSGEVGKKSMIPMAVRLTHAVDGVVDVLDQLTFSVDDTALPATADMEEYRHSGSIPGVPSLKQIE